MEKEIHAESDEELIEKAISNLREMERASFLLSWKAEGGMDFLRFFTEANLRGSSTFGRPLDRSQFELQFEMDRRIGSRDRHGAFPEDDTRLILDWGLRFEDWKLYFKQKPRLLMKPPSYDDWSESDWRQVSSPYFFDNLPADQWVEFDPKEVNWHDFSAWEDIHLLQIAGGLLSLLQEHELIRWELINETNSTEGRLKTFDANFQAGSDRLGPFFSDLRNIIDDLNTTLESSVKGFDHFLELVLLLQVATEKGPGGLTEDERNRADEIFEYIDSLSLDPNLLDFLIGLTQAKEGFNKVLESEQARWVGSSENIAELLNKKFDVEVVVNLKGGNVYFKSLKITGTGEEIADQLVEMTEAFAFEYDREPVVGMTRSFELKIEIDDIDKRIKIEVPDYTSLNESLDDNIRSNMLEMQKVANRYYRQEGKYELCGYGSYSQERFMMEEMFQNAMASAPGLEKRFFGDPVVREYCKVGPEGQSWIAILPLNKEAGVGFCVSSQGLENQSMEVKSTQPQVEKTGYDCRRYR